MYNANEGLANVGLCTHFYTVEHEIWKFRNFRRKVFHLVILRMTKFRKYTWRSLIAQNGISGIRFIAHSSR